MHMDKYAASENVERGYDFRDQSDALTAILDGKANVGDISVTTLRDIITSEIPQRNAKLNEQLSILVQAARDILTLIVDPRDDTAEEPAIESRNSYLDRMETR